MALSDRFAGARLALTGVTGFVGQALLAQLLEAAPDAEIVVLARDRPGEPAADRVRTLISSATAFAPLREAGRAGAAADRITVLPADLGSPDLDLPQVDVLVHVAGTVSFDTRIDEAFRTHVTGVDQLYGAARAAGCEHVVHVSTAYVAARQPGPMPEGPVRQDVDWRQEAGAATELAHRVELASRQPARLARYLADARRAVGPHGDGPIGEEAERARRRWVDRELVEAGRQRARTLGFADVYTFSKAMGERVAEEWYRDHALTIVRPSIVESALRHPSPGWIEGFKVADPLIIGLGRGDIPEFPGFPDSVVDVIPVDFVANAIIVAAAHPPEHGSPRYMTVGSGARNPLSLHRMYGLVRGAFDAHPLPGHRGAPRLPTWRFPGVDTVERQLKVASRLSGAAADVVRRSPVTGERLRRLGRTLDRQHRRFQTLDRFLALYGIYSQTETVFLDDAAQALRDGLAPEDRDRFGFDPLDIDWEHYLVEVHIPAVSAFFRLADPYRPKPSPGPAPLPEGSDDGVLAVFDLDGTVASTNVLSTYLRARWSDDPRAAVGEAADVLRQLPRYLALDASGRDRFLRAFYRRFAGADVAALDRLVADELGDRLLLDLSPAAVRRIREHRDRGHHTVLVTGALRSFCEPLRSLFDTIAAAELATDEAGIATGHLASPPLVGATRAAWLREYAKQIGADLDRSFAYADSRSDAPLLRAVGNPVAVDPDVALHRLARRQGWAVAAWRTADRAPARAG